MWSVRADGAAESRMADAAEMTAGKITVGDAEASVTAEKDAETRKNGALSVTGNRESVERNLPEEGRMTGMCAG